VAVVADGEREHAIVRFDDDVYGGGVGVLRRIRQITTRTHLGGTWCA
jgi:hypothetical protein